MNVVPISNDHLIRYT